MDPENDLDLDFRFIDFLQNKNCNILVVWNSTALRCQTIIR